MKIEAKIKTKTVISFDLFVYLCFYQKSNFM